MGTHIIWRNPSPPRKRAIHVSRIAGNHVAAAYQAEIPDGFKRLFQVVRGKPVALAATASAVKVAAAQPSPGTRLVSARW